jgi:hypothetical protein
MILNRLLPACLLAVTFACAAQQCPGTTPTEGAPPPQPLPVFPSDNWWNLDITQAPLDPRSDDYIGYIGHASLHPEFGGTVHKGSATVYGYPYAVVAGSQAKLAVKMDYYDESDGVNNKTGKPFPFYPIPADAITQAHWIEGGWAGNVDKRRQSDRHMMVVDCTNRMLYELYSVYYDPDKKQWHAGSGAAWDMTTNDARQEGWTSGEASGLQMFPGMVRYDEAWNDSLPVIQHALRVTLRAVDGHVWPATHSDGTSSGALPFGARLRLKMSVDGKDPALRTSNPNVRKIFRAMQTYGLIFSAVGSDMFISGTFDTRWNNGILNPEFAKLSADDFEVVKLGWTP